MEKGWQSRPGDRILRRPRIAEDRPRRTLGIPGLLGAAYGNAGSSIYYALGVVALVALGATPIALLLAGLLFIFTALSYAEGTAMLPEAGGSANFARHGFNDLVGFVAGWASMLSYIATIAICAYTIPPYLGHFEALHALKDNPSVGTATSMGIILVLMLGNVVGIRESSRLNVMSAALDLLTQISIIISGIALITISDPIRLAHHMFGPDNWPPSWPQLIHGIDGYWPGWTGLAFGIAIATLAFTGVETVSRMAEETKHPQKRSPRALLLTTAVVLVIFTGIAIVALSALNTQELSDAALWARDPVAGIAANLPSETMQRVYEPLVALLAGTMLLLAANTGVMGVSRLAFSMGTYKLLPTSLTKVHERFRTPYISLILFCVVAVIMLVPGRTNTAYLKELGALYTFGALISFALAHAAIISLRIRKPELMRPFKLHLNIRVRNREIPFSAVLGLIITSGIWLVIVVAEDINSLWGFVWMLTGLIIYCYYRRQNRLPLT